MINLRGHFVVPVWVAETNMSLLNSGQNEESGSTCWTHLGVSLEPNRCQTDYGKNKTT